MQAEEFPTNQLCLLLLLLHPLDSRGQVHHHCQAPLHTDIHQNGEKSVY